MSYFFSDFETLGVFGPVEIFGKAEGFDIEYYSLDGGLGKRNLIHDKVFIDHIKNLSENSIYV